MYCKKLYKILLISLLYLSLPLYIGAQITYFPDIEKQDLDNIHIKKVEITDQFTIIDFFYRPNGESWICVDKTFHITPSRVSDLAYMIMAENITICPKMQKVGPFSEDLEFKVWFPKLEKNIRKIDVIENKRDRQGINFYGISIINGQEKSIPDSLDQKNKKSFEEFFLKYSDSLDPIEGIWNVELSKTQYRDGQIIDHNYELKNLEIALVKNGNTIHAYDLSGKSLESNFTRVSGGNSYFFRKYFREVNQEVSSYINFITGKEFNLIITIPESMARYELLKEFFPLDKIVYKHRFTKNFPPLQQQ